ncbi:MAG: hypothetical protein ACYTHM_23150 [Planctomycetota bacterium]
MYWPYFNWTIVHAGSREEGLNAREAKPEYKTCFGGRHGHKNTGGNDACMDFEYVRDAFRDKYIPDADLFLVHVDGHNGWPTSWRMQVVGTSHFRYCGQILGQFRLGDGELWGNGFLLPKQRTRFDAKWKAFQDEVREEAEKTRNLSVREWRKLTASRKMLMTHRRNMKLPKRDRNDGEPQEKGGILRRMNEIIDKRRYPDDMKLQDRPFPDFNEVPWMHWLWKREPTVTIFPTLLAGFSNTHMSDFRVKPNGELELHYNAKPWQVEVIKRQFGGRMPNEKEIRDRIRVSYFAHEKCVLGGFGSEGSGGACTQFCAACLEEFVRAIYRYVSPIDDHAPKKEEITLAKPRDSLTLSVFPMKPLDRFLTVEWRVDGKRQKGNLKRTLRLRGKNGKTRVIKGVPPFKSQRRPRAYFHPAQTRANVDRALLRCAFFHANLSVQESFTLLASGLSPGAHEVEVTVIDETPWVLWDPENLLTETRRWKVIVPERGD